MTRPRFIYAYAEMAEVAEDVRRNRAEGDLALVDAGKLSIEDADMRLRISAAIAVDWKAYARMELPPLDRTTDAEKVADLQAVLAGAEKRRDHARTAMMHEYGAAIGGLSLGELWAIHDSHDTRSLRILPYLRWESYAAAIEAILWWQQRPRYESRRFITMVNQQLRGMGYVEQERAAA
ncbi:hypothetical protein [Sphingomonas sp. PP-CE-1G-424]|uniref:hypothetical protein n=1 Tax=Sphingomonas sp. PP-CE-1G-424 TaxID=2135658 RepID=UPI001055C7B8|nr:hypothetical protein [Sphingomonas sp. PP-CE-1G-424]TCP71850.1 hypothetical protein C8J43_102935 [Sphingomonas sp. PP-CE-1G-424]